MNSHNALPDLSLHLLISFSSWFKWLHAHWTTTEEEMVLKESPEVTFPAVLFSQRSFSCSTSFITSHICTEDPCERDTEKKRDLAVKNMDVVPCFCSLKVSCPEGQLWSNVNKSCFRCFLLSGCRIAHKNLRGAGVLTDAITQID